MTKTYRVVSPYITAKTAGFAGVLPGARGGYVRIGLYRGALVPADCPDGETKRLLARKMIEEVTQDA